MAKDAPRQQTGHLQGIEPAATPTRRRSTIVLFSAGLAMSLLAAAFVLLRNKPPAPDPLEPSSDRVVNTNAAPAAAVATMNVAQAVMVTVDLDFGPKLPSIAEALRDVERRHEPEDGVGRTFSIIEAFGEPTPEGKLRVSMHVSTEKPGMGALAFKRTGETLWRSRINAGTNHATANPPNSKNLTVFLDNLQGKTWVVDGSNNPDLLLAAHLRDSGLAVSSVWQDGVEMEVGFIYSSCGCPVKVRAKRMGDGTIRTKELPVIFPDDLAVVRVIEKLMRW